MAAKILVTYSSKYGSTREVAETISRKLTEGYFAVDLIPSRQVKNLNEYDAVIIGAPIYAGSILSDTIKFLNQNKDALEKIPTAFFVLGPLDGSPQEIRGVQAQLGANHKKKFNWYKPTTTKIFSGVLDLSKLRFPDSLIKLYRSTPRNPLVNKDGRDWKDINAWADSLPDILKIK